MSATHFHDFTRDDGSPVTVEYSFSAGSPTTYSPHSGACGGDPCEVEIISVMPNTPGYEALCRRSLELARVDIVLMSADEREERREVDEAIEAAKKNCVLTDAEDERMTEWLIEHHVDMGEPEDWEF